MPRALALVGATGAMGRLVQEIVALDPAYEIVAGLDSRSSLDALRGVDLVVDVTRLDVSRRVVDRCLEEDLPVLVGTSGWTAPLLDDLRRRIAGQGRGTVAVVPNFSIGSVVGSVLSRVAATVLPDVELVEIHPRSKPDSPSGTAIHTAQLISDARTSRAEPAHADQPARGVQVGGVQVHSLRLGGVHGVQQAIFSGTEEVLTIGHETYSAQAYAPGIRLALDALPHRPGLSVGLAELVDLGVVSELSGRA